MGPRPTPAHSLDRIKNELGYSKENCRWATPTQQANNQRKTMRLTVDGRTQSVKDWCRELNLNYEAVRYRIYNQWPRELVLSPTSQPFKPYFA